MHRDIRLIFMRSRYYLEAILSSVLASSVFPPRSDADLNRAAGTSLSGHFKHFEKVEAKTLFQFHVLPIAKRTSR
jgi:hypothetical protein